jgi:hypothetical protein
MSSQSPSYPLPTQHLLNAAIRLAAELEEARLYGAAAYASMAADAIRSAEPPQAEASKPT